jgi:hypothetical protein
MNLYSREKNPIYQKKKNFFFGGGDAIIKTMNIAMLHTIKLTVDKKVTGEPWFPGLTLKTVLN